MSTMNRILTATLLLVVVPTTRAFSALPPTSRRWATSRQSVQQQQQVQLQRNQHRLRVFLSEEETKQEQTADEKKNIENAKDVVASASETTIELDAVTIVASQDTAKPQAPTTTSDNKKNSSFLSEGLLWRGVVVALCAVWASNFAVAKLVMAEPGVDSSLYALARFGTAATALAVPSLWQAWTHQQKESTSSPIMDWETAKGAAACGAWVAFGYLGQTVGLLTTTASRSCVICTLHCVFVAIVAEALRVSRASQLATTTTAGNNDETSSADNDETNNAQFDVSRLLPAAVAVAGVALVELKGAGGAPTIGDALSFAQPIGFGLGYLQLEELMRKRPEAALPVSAMKLAVVAAASLCFFELSPWILHQQQPVVGSALALPGLPDFGPILQSPVALGGILYTGLITTAAALWIESIAFKRVPATDASIILTTEPLFAAAAGASFLGETFGLSDYIGATMIIGACALAVLMDDEASSDQCSVDESLQGICEPPRTVPISAE